MRIKKQICILLLTALLLTALPVGGRAAAEEAPTLDGVPNPNYLLTGDQAEDIAAVAEAQAGKMAADFGFGVDWCALFVSWCGSIAAPELITELYRYGKDMAVDLCNRGLGRLYYFPSEARASLDNHNAGVPDYGTGNYIQTTPDAFEPRRGDLILFSFDYPDFSWDHIGIVTEVYGDAVYYTDGNSGNTASGTDPGTPWAGRSVNVNNAVAWDSDTIIGYLRPNYSVREVPGEYGDRVLFEDAGGVYCFRRGGMLLTGWVLLTAAEAAPLGGAAGWRYFGDNGRMGRNWQEIDGVWYFFGPDGAMGTGWQEIDGVWYYLGENGAMRTGWQKLSGVWYYLGEDGAMSTGWQKLGGVWYYLGENGAMGTGWQKLGGVWYYCKNSGAMAAGETVGGYVFDATGAWVG